MAVGARSTSDQKPRGVSDASATSSPVAASYDGECRLQVGSSRHPAAGQLVLEERQAPHLPDPYARTMTAFLEPDHATSDLDLIARARGTDPEAVEELYRRHRDAALRFARSLTDPVTAEDVVAEAFAEHGN